MRMRLPKVGDVTAHMLIERARSALLNNAEQDDLWSFYHVVRRMADQIYPIDAISICRYFDDRRLLSYVFLAEKGPGHSWETGRIMQGSEWPLGDGPTSQVIRTRQSYAEGPDDERKGVTFGAGVRCKAALHLPVFSAFQSSPVAVLGV